MTNPLAKLPRPGTKRQTEDAPASQAGAGAPPEQKRRRSLNQHQKYALALIAFAFVAIAAVYAFSLAVLVYLDIFASGSINSDRELYFPWRIAKLFAELGTWINVVFAGVIAIIAAGTGWMTEVFRKRWQLWLIVLSCLVGLASAFYLMVELGPGEIAQIKLYGDLFDNLVSDIERLHRTKSAIFAFEIELISLFSFFLASCLGVRVAPEDGRLRNFLKELFGKGGEE